MVAEIKNYISTHPSPPITIKLFYFLLTLNKDEICQKTFVKHLQLFTLAESLGGVESLICHPATMTHAALSPDAQENAGIGSNLFRLSVGIEDAQDLINDLNTALSRSTLKALKAS